MKYTNIAGYPGIDAYVDAKIRRFGEMEKNFTSFFSLMFSEKENTLFESTDGYRIRKVTYGECEDRIRRRAASLRERLGGEVPGAIVAIALENGEDFIELFWAVLLAGFCPMLVNLRLPEEAVRGVFARCSVCAVLSEGRDYGAPVIRPGEIPAGEAVLDGGETGTEMFVMSSGTSNHVKVCAYTAEQFYYQVLGTRGIIRECAQAKRHVDGELKLLAFLPFYHIFGFFAVYVWFTFFSRTLVLLGDMTPQTIQDTIRKHKVTHVFAVPLFWETVYRQAMRKIRERGEETYRKLQKGLKLARRPLVGGIVTRRAFREVREGIFGESICFTITGGSGVSPAVLEFFNAVGYHLVNGYGMTEIGITSVELSPKASCRMSGTVGHPMAGVEYRVDDDGELWVRSRSMAAYAWEEDGKHPLAGTWFPTHDLAAKHGERYEILGRRDDVIVSASGENINPNLIEDGFLLPGVTGACLVCRDGVPTMLLSVSRYLRPSRLREVDAAVRAHLREADLTAAIPSVLYVGESLLGRDEFKLNRRRIAQQLRDGGFTLLDPAREDEEDGTVDEALASRVRAAIFAILPDAEPDFSLTADFYADLGGTSLDYFALLSLLSEEFGIPFPSDGEHSFTTAAAICRYIGETV